MWLHDEGMRSDQNCVWRIVSDNKPPFPGRLLPTSAGAIAEFNPRDLHGTEHFTGHRVMLLAYTPSGIQKDAEEELQQLANMGFVHHQLPSLKDQQRYPQHHRSKPHTHTHTPLSPRFGFRRSQRFGSSAPRALLVILKMSLMRWEWVSKD